MPGYLMSAYNDNSDNADQPVSAGYVAGHISGNDSNINFLKLKLYKIGTPGSLNVSIRAGSVGNPILPDIVIASVNFNSLPDAPSLWFGFWIPVVFLSSVTPGGAGYYIVVNGTGLTPGVNDVYWRVNNTGGGMETSPTGADGSWTGTATEAQYETWLALYGKPLGLNKG